MAKLRLHINQHNIRKNNNKQQGQTLLPVITAKTYKENNYYHSVSITDIDTGKEFAKVIYSPNAPLNCGAKVWIEMDSDQVVLTEIGEDDIHEQ